MAKAKIKKEEKIDAKVTNALLHTCKLRKKFYIIPNIEIPESISSVEEMSPTG